MRLLAALLAALLAGCSTTATIHRVRGPSLEGRIAHSEENALFVEGSDRRLYRVDSSTIRDVDHPGNVTAVVGMVLIGLGALAFGGATADRSNDFARENAVLITSPYWLTGLGLLLGGGAVWLRSTDAASRMTPYVGAPSELDPEDTPAVP